MWKKKTVVINWMATVFGYWGILIGIFAVRLLSCTQGVEQGDDRGDCVDVL